MTTATATATAQTFQIGQVVTGSFGYDMTLNEFYIVERVSDSSVWIRQVSTQVSNDNGRGNGAAIADPALEPFGPLTRHKIQRSYMNGEPWLRHKCLGFLRLWDGRPKYQNSYD